MSDSKKLRKIIRDKANYDTRVTTEHTVSMRKLNFDLSHVIREENTVGGD